MKSGLPETPHLDTAADKQRRFQSEAAMFAQADADIAAGRLVGEAEVDTWIDGIGTTKR